MPSPCPRPAARQRAIVALSGVSWVRGIDTSFVCAPRGVLHVQAEPEAHHASRYQASSLLMEESAGSSGECASPLTLPSSGSCRRSDFLHVCKTRQGACSSLWLPDLHRHIVAAGGDKLAIRRPGHIRDTARMPSIGIQLHPGGGVPDLHHM